MRTGGALGRVLTADPGRPPSVRHDVRGSDRGLGSCVRHGYLPSSFRVQGGSCVSTPVSPLLPVPDVYRGPGLFTLKYG